MNTADPDAHPYEWTLRERVAYSLGWLYGDPLARMRSPEFVADLAKWTRLSRP